MDEYTNANWREFSSCWGMFIRELWSIVSSAFKHLNILLIINVINIY